MILTKEQESRVKQFNDALERAVSVYEVDKGAICIVTPFLDWQGLPARFYVTHEGRVTDGGNTRNVLQAMRSLEQFEDWPFQTDFFTSYLISFDGESMTLNERNEGEGLFRYAQGISRLPSFFEPRPIHTTEDRFPERVKAIAAKIITARYGNKPPEETKKFVSQVISSKKVQLDNGYMVTSDLSPLDRNKIVTVISHANENFSDRRAHVQAKLLDPILWKDENSKHKCCAVLEDIRAYPDTSKNLLGIIADQIIELREDGDGEALADVLTTR